MALDPHTNYLTQEEHEDFMISNNLKLEGIGVQLRSEDGYTVVDRIIPGVLPISFPENYSSSPMTALLLLRRIRMNRLMLWIWICAMLLR